MKREYMKPEVEKISFCYRDQVVAASGGGVGGGEVGGGSGGNPSTGEQIVGRIAEGLGINGCAEFECDYLFD